MTPCSTMATPATSEAVSKARQTGSSSAISTLIAQLAEQRLVARTLCLGAHAPRLLARRLETGEQVFGRHLLHRAVGPLDQQQTVQRVFLQAQLEHLDWVLQPEQVGVIDVQPAVVLIDEDERRAL